jgi:hypothetical protein
VTRINQDLTRIFMMFRIGRIRPGYKGFLEISEFKKIMD